MVAITVSPHGDRTYIKTTACAFCGEAIDGANGYSLPTHLRNDCPYTQGGGE